MDSVEAIEELAQLSDSMRQAAALLADEDVDETSTSGASSRRPSTFLNVVALGNVVSSTSLLIPYRITLCSFRIYLPFAHALFLKFSKISHGSGRSYLDWILEIPKLMSFFQKCTTPVIEIDT